jgi:hypothetical protein
MGAPFPLSIDQNMQWKDVHPETAKKPCPVVFSCIQLDILSTASSYISNYIYPAIAGYRLDTQSIFRSVLSQHVASTVPPLPRRPASTPIARFERSCSPAGAGSAASALQGIEEGCLRRLGTQR